MTEIFPLYRKLSNNLVFYKILSETAFEELRLIGNSYKIETHGAKIHPDFVLIRDMISCEENRWELSDENEFNCMLEDCRKNKKLLA